jgi:MFS family permease
MHPAWFVPMTLVAGLMASGPAAGAALRQYGYRRLAWVVGPVLFVLGLALTVFAVLWKVEWYWAALFLAAAHLCGGTALFLALRRPYARYRERNPPPRREPGTYRQIIGGIVGGTLIGGLLGTTGMVFYLLLMDRLESTAWPVLFDDTYAVMRVFTGGFFLAVSGAIAGGLLGRFRPRATGGQTVLFGLLLIWTHLGWVAAVEALVAIPIFQAGAATGRGWQAVITPLTLGHFLVGTWWAVLLLFFVIAPPGRAARLKRAGLVLGMNVAAAVTLVLSFGYVPEVFLAVGRSLERGAHVGAALRSYELGLDKQPEEQVASWLQYRVALLYHKRGEREKAEQGFRRVVAKYTANAELVKKASRFLDNLERHGRGRRVVLPGVETRTEYKSSYCVPNSLALVMRYWGDELGARAIGERITGLSSGTIVVNQSWLADQEGFRHDFLPMASLDDIEQLIDAGFPVLVYVPAHVLVIVGYDEALETFVTYDVATQDIWAEYLQKDFVKAWKKQATTLALAYPPGKEARLPEGIRARIARLSDGYLHFQLHYFDAPEDAVSVPHLLRAAGDSGEFFFPVTILYSDFPGLRGTVQERYDPDSIAQSIRGYFGNDFDEGAHLFGQYHDERWGWPDWALRDSVQYLIGQGRFDLLEELGRRIDAEGKLSDSTLAELAVVDLAQGRLRQGLDRLERADQSGRPLYAALAEAGIGDEQGAVRKLVKALSGYT